MEKYEQEVFDLMGPFLTQKGFVANRPMKQFRHYTPTGFQSIMLSVSGHGPYYLDVHLGIRSDQVEHMAYQFTTSPASFANHATTIAPPLHALDISIPKKLTFDSSTDLKAACEYLEVILEDQGLGFLSDSTPVNALDRLLNANPEGESPYMHNQLNRYFRGLVVAKMAQNPDIQHLTDTYHKAIKKRGAPQRVVQNYERLAVMLHYFSFN